MELFAVLALVLVVALLIWAVRSPQRWRHERHTADTLTIATDQLALRPATPGDRLPVAQTLDATILAENGWTEREHDLLLKALDAPRGNPSHMVFVVDAQGSGVVGAVTAVGDPTLSVGGLPAWHIGFWIGPGHRRRGYATDAVGLVTTLAAQHAGAVTAHVRATNTASRRVLEENGYEQHGSLIQRLPDGTDVDGVMYRKLLR